MYFQKGVFIMNEKVLKTLEYNKITEKLEGYAATDMARRMCHELQPMTDITSIEAALSNTNDALGRSITHSAPSFGGFADCRMCIKRLEAGGSLNTRELLNIGSILEAAARASSYAGNKEEADSLTPLFESLDPVTSLAAELKRCILSEDEISDDASQNLKDIRRKIKAGQDKIHT